MKIHIFACNFLFISSVATAQPAANFYPHHRGDVWQYRWVSNGQIARTRYLDSVRVEPLSRDAFLFFRPINIGPRERIDSMLNVFDLNGQAEYPRYKLSAAGNAIPGSVYQSGKGVSIARLDSTNTVTTTRGDSVKLSAPALYGGSSWAAPVAGGVAAFMRSINPYMPLADLRAILIDTSSCNTVSQSGTGGGRIDAFKAIKNVTGTPYLHSLDLTEPDERGFIHPILNWTANPLIPSMVVSEYIVQKRRPLETNFQDIDSVAGSTTSYTDMTEYIPTEWTPWAATEYRIRAKLDYNGSIVLSVPSNVQSIGSAPMEKGNLQSTVARFPATTRLVDNYPNPFNPATTIRFDIAEEGFVTLRLFDVLGKQVSSLVSEWMQPGSYSRVLDASSLATGVYFYRLQLGRFVDTRKLILTK